MKLTTRIVANRAMWMYSGWVERAVNMANLKHHFYAQPQELETGENLPQLFPSLGPGPLGWKPGSTDPIEWLVLSRGAEEKSHAAATA